MNLLLQDSITLKMLQKAQVLLIKFLFYFEKYYGKQYMYYNMHLLLHLTETVMNWGPLWTINTFSFEEENKHLLKKKTCNNRIAQQIVYRLLIYQQLPVLENKPYISDKTRKFCANFQNSNQLKNVNKIEDCILLGSGQSHSLSHNEVDYVKNVLSIPEVTKCTKYSKIIYNGYRYTTYSSGNCRQNNLIFETENGIFGLIRKISKIEYNNDCYVIIFYNELCVKEKLIENNELCIEHLRYCELLSNDNLQIVNYNVLFRPCILMYLRKKFVIGTLAKGLLTKHAN